MSIAQKPTSVNYGIRTLELECAAITNAPKSNANVQLNTSAFKVGQVVGAGLIDLEKAKQELARAASDRGIGKPEAAATIKSGLDGGIKNPRGPSNGGNRKTSPSPSKPIEFKPAANTDAEDTRKRNVASKTWLDATPIDGTPAERYLEGRAITATSPELRYATACPIWSGRANESKQTALIAVVRNVKTQKRQAIVRIFIAADGSGKAMLDDGDKRNLGPTRDGAVNFGKILEGDTVIECEGVESALSLWQATSIPTIAVLSGDALGRAALPTNIKRVIIHAEHGTEKFAIAGAERRAAAGLEVSLAASPDASLKDANDLLQARGNKAVKLMIEHARRFREPPHDDAPTVEPVAVDDADDMDPIPLAREIKAATGAFPLDALGDLEPVVRAIASTVQAPAAMVAQSVLSAVCLAAQAQVSVQLPIGSSEPTPVSIFLASVAGTGDRKTTSDNIALRAVKEREAHLAQIYAEGRTVYEANFAAWKSENSRIVNDKKLSRDEKQRQLIALGAEPRPILTPTLIAEEPTFEGLMKSFVNGQPSMGLFSNEGGQFVGGHGMQDDAKLRGSVRPKCRSAGLGAHRFELSPAKSRP